MPQLNVYFSSLDQLLYTPGKLVAMCNVLGYDKYKVLKLFEFVEW